LPTPPSDFEVNREGWINGAEARYDIACSKGAPGTIRNPAFDATTTGLSDIPITSSKFRFVIAK
jgi:hypothetical protein